MVKLDLAVFANADANWRSGLDPYLSLAAAKLAPLAIELNVFPARPADPTLLLTNGPVFDRVPDAPPNPFALLAGDVRFACSVALPAGHGIPVIFCRFNRTGDAGVTIFTSDLAVNRNIRWLNYVLINAAIVNANHAVLLHELIHAADYVGNTGFGNKHDSDNTSIMRESEAVPGLPPPVVFERHAAALRRCYFARPA